GWFSPDPGYRGSTRPSRTAPARERRCRAGARCVRAAGVARACRKAASLSRIPCVFSLPGSASAQRVPACERDWPGRRPLRDRVSTGLPASVENLGFGCQVESIVGGGGFLV